MPVFRLVCLIIIGSLLMGCTMISPINIITPAGRTTTRSLDLAGFDKLDISHAFTVDVTQADAYKVEITVDDNLLDRLDVRVSGDTLYIGLKTVTISGPATMQALVAMPALRSLNLSGATRGTIHGFASQQTLDVTVSGASQLSGDITCGDARLDVSGASRVELRGAAETVRAVVSGASTLALDAFPAGDVDVEASGGSRATVNVNGRLNATASGASTVLYTGEPVSVRENVSGASTIRPK